MRIVYVDETFHPAYGYQSNPLAKFQNKQGNEVIIVTVSKDQIHPVYRAFGDNGETVEEDDKKYTLNTGVKIVRVKTYGYFMHRAVYNNTLFKTVRSLNPDVVFVHCVETLTAMRFLMHKKEWPLLFDSHMLSMASQSKFVGMYEAVYRAFFKRIIEKNQYFVIRTQDDNYVNHNLGISESLTPFISFGTDTMMFAPSSQVRDSFRKANNIPEDDFVVIYTGKLTAEKNGMLLADAFYEKFDTNVTLVCVGSPPDDEYGKNVVNRLKESKNRVIMFPTQGYMDLPKFYQMADLSVFPKQCSMSFYDAQSCGLPVVSEENNVNCQRCSHDNGDNFKPGDVADFRAKILKFAHMDREEWGRFSKNSRKFIESGYDYALIAEEYTRYLKKAIIDYKKNK